MSKSIMYNQNVTDYMFHKYNMKQFVHDYTAVQNFATDLCFIIQYSNFYFVEHWADHKIISFPIM